MNNKYYSYENALDKLNLDTLEKRRKMLTLRWPNKAKIHEKTKHLFQLNTKRHSMNSRNEEKYKVLHAKTKRYQKSKIIQMQKMLNTEEKYKQKK